MASKFKFVDHTADIAVDAEADTIEELFIISAQAWKESVFGESIIEEKEKKKIDIAERDTELLLVKFLDELNFLFQAKKWACGSIKEIIIKKNKEWYLSALILGELFKEKKHSVNAEIKAVTFHQLEIRNISGKYSTRIVFDI